MKQAFEHRFEFLLEDWVNTNTHTQNYPGIKKFLNSLEEELKELGLTTEWHPPFIEGQKTDQPSALFATLPATGDQPGPQITFVTHADTVFPLSSPFQTLTWSDDRNHAFGPGVIDDKGSILIALFLLEKMTSKESRNFTLHFLCMPGEEVGSPGFAKVMEKISFRSQYLIGMEPALADGSIIHSRRGNRWMEVTTEGPGGHAGRDAGKVINPLESLIKKITLIQDALHSLRGVSMSVGAILTDSQEFNVIPSKATAKLDLRFETNELKKEVEQKMEPFLKDTSWKWAEDCPAMGLEPKSEALHKKALQLIEKHEKRPVKIQMGFGSSDCNHLARPGLIILDGMGAVGTGLHTQQETIEINSLFTRARVLIDLVNWIEQQHA